ncbi:MAG: hypothetical protein A2Y10_16815 [Planctomycetes bacterium GWF2_41_51]|nr:MAG: hypothetical protein A2Y10_16815 [Planctomycetes bacterium GWF2_41_51]
MGCSSVRRLDSYGLYHNFDCLSGGEVFGTLIVMEIKNKANESDIKRETRLLESSQLFGSDNEIMIRHQGSVYRLRITRNGKLIMNK